MESRAIYLHHIQVRLQLKLEIRLCQVIQNSYCKTGNFHVQENFAIFAKIGRFAKFFCRENVCFLILWCYNCTSRLS